MFSQIPSITGKDTLQLDRVDVSSSLPIRKTKKHTSHSTEKPYQISRPGEKDKVDFQYRKPILIRDHFILRNSEKILVLNQDLSGKNLPEFLKYRFAAINICEARIKVGWNHSYNNDIQYIAYWLVLIQIYLIGLLLYI